MSDQPTSAAPGRRTAAVVAVAAALAVVVAVVLVLVLRDSDDGAVTVGTAPASTTAAEVTVATTAPTTPAPATTAETTAPTTAPPSTTAAPTTTTTPPAPSGPVPVVDAAGDARLLDGDSILLFDGPDPDDPPPEEGDTFAVDGIAVAPDRVFIGLCCEPVAGTLLATTPPAPATFDSSLGFGHAPSLDPTGTRLARVVYDAVVVSDLELAEQASIPVPTEERLALEVTWVGADRLVVLTVGPDGTTLWTYAVDGASVSPITSARVATTRWDQPDPLPTLAGTADGAVYLLEPDASTLLAFDASSIARLGDQDVALDGPARSAWVVDGSVRWVGTDRTLHLGDSVVPGEYVWVR